MFSADFIPCTLTLPLISPAQLTLAQSKAANIPTVINIFLESFILVPFGYEIFPDPVEGREVSNSLENVVNTCRESIRPEELAGVGIGLLPAVGVLKRRLDVVANEELDPRAETAARVVFGSSVQEIGGRIDHVIAHQSDHPGIDPILGFRKSAAVSNRRGAVQSCVGGVRKKIIVTSVHAEGV